jgi:phage tail sheath protein FI
MPEYLAPGVYIEEIPPRGRPIEGVSTSVAGFVGLTERGPTVPPKLVTSWDEYFRWYGGHVDTAISYLPHAVRGFFHNGGKRLYVARITDRTARVASLDLGTADVGQDLQVRAVGAGDWGNRIFVRIDRGTLAGRRITVLYCRTPPPARPVDPGNADRTEEFDNLTVDPLGEDYMVEVINSRSRLITVDWSNPGIDPSEPAVGAYAPLTGGGDGEAGLTAEDFAGEPAAPPDLRTGLAALGDIDGISLLCNPDHVHPARTGAQGERMMNDLITHCERLRYRFAILQIEGGQGDVQAIRVPGDTSRAAVYHPWVRVADPMTRGTVLVPSVGHVAGIYARTDTERGVHRVPANTVVRGLVGNEQPLEYIINRDQQDLLNPLGINVLRDFRADRRGVRVWGARTMSGDPRLRHVNVRRLLNFIEESIDKGTRWAVFEPNNEETWAAVRESIRAFLEKVWKNGALMGATRKEAFFVKCDREAMTQDDIDNGRLVCLVGVAPVRPAEFVVIRVSHSTK